MSYDIRFGVQTVEANNDGENMCIVGAPELDSPTYNLRPMFVACMDWEYEQGKWYPMTEVLPKIEHGIDELTKHRKKYEKYNSPNGWGTLDGARECLENWKDAVTSDGWDYDKPIHLWPVETLWFRW